MERGIYAVNFGGGQVDITSGKFVFSASEAYLIENGKLGAPVKGATLIGNGPDVLTRVSMVGNDLKLDDGVGTCGKDGQSVPVGVGQPTLRVDALTVGGTQHSRAGAWRDALASTHVRSPPVYESLPCLYIACRRSAAAGRQLPAERARRAERCSRAVAGIVCAASAGVVLWLRRRDYRTLRSQYGGRRRSAGSDKP